MAAEELDLRTQLEQAFSAAKEDPPEKVETPPSAEAAPAPAGDERPRDERGRFVSGVEKPQEEPAAAAVQSAPDPKAAAQAAPAAPDPKAAAAPAASAPAALAPPNGWSAEAKAKWHELPAEIQAAVSKRETDIAKFTGKTDDERAFGREMQRVVAPYLAQIQAEGGTPAGAVQSLLNTAYVLRNGSSEQKQQALIAVAQQFNIPIPNSADAPPAATGDPALLQRIGQLESRLQQYEQGSTQARQADIQTEIEAFAADPSHPHFEEVRAVMGALMTSGAAKSLQDAYDQACYARPDIRATLQAQQRAQEEQKRRSEEKARADAARAKAVSITGGPGSAAPTAPANRSLREELEANFRTSSGLV